MIALVVNPAAGNGRARARAGDVMRAMTQRHVVREFASTKPGDEAHQTERAIAAGAQRLVVIGGDGAVHHAVRGLLRAPRRVPMAIIAAGSGNDFVKSLGTPAHDVSAMIRRIEHGEVRAVDIGDIDGTPFVNAAGLGFDVSVLERMRPQTSRWLGGTAAYVTTALGELFGYEGFSAKFQMDGAEALPSTTHLLTVFANGQFFGSTFRIAPAAALDDGMLNVIDIGAMAPWRRPLVFLRAARGAHLSSAMVRTFTGQSCTLHCDTPPTYEADGELYQATDRRVTVSVRAAAIDIIV